LPIASHIRSVDFSEFQNDVEFQIISMSPYYVFTLNSDTGIMWPGFLLRVAIKSNALLETSIFNC